MRCRTATYLLGTATGFNTNNYYGGNPLNPRFIQPNLFTDNEHTFDQELRLVSKTGPDDMFDYVVGVFYEDQERVGSWYSPDPGSPERAMQQGCTAPYYAGASFPDCLLTTGPGDENFTQIDTQNFSDKSEFGELTWHFTSQGQITFGGRHFDQTVYRRAVVPRLYVRPVDSPRRRATRRRRRIPGRSIRPTNTRRISMSMRFGRRVFGEAAPTRCRRWGSTRKARCWQPMLRIR